MLAHLKAKHREQHQDGAPPSSVEEPPSASSPPLATSDNMDDEKHDARLTCAALCSLSASCGIPAQHVGTNDPNSECMMGRGAPAAVDATVAEEARSTATLGIHGFLFVDDEDDDDDDSSPKTKSLKGCPKQHQLPMFLSKTYHMIDRCDPEIATWSPTGDNFVVKNVDQFASTVLPLYFKHSNFSSFARQLNFYGFRKLRSDPILTNDVDPRTACYVRFYHEKFQKNRPELLHQIKRATKSDQQSKDDVDSLKSEVWKLRDCVHTMSTEMDRKLAEMSYEYNRRISNLSAEYEKLAALVTQVLQQQQQQQQFHHQQQLHQHHHSKTAYSETTISGSSPLNALQHTAAAPPLGVPSPAMVSSMQSSAVAPENKLQSLSQVVAMSLQNHHLHHRNPLMDPPPGGSGEDASLSSGTNCIFREMTSYNVTASSSTSSAGTKRVATEEDPSASGGVGKARLS